VPRLGREHETSTATGAQPILAHQPGNALAPDAMTTGTQLGMDPRTAGSDAPV
jgi:hypothetical protein